VATADLPAVLAAGVAPELESVCVQGSVDCQALMWFALQADAANINIYIKDLTL